MTVYLVSHVLIVTYELKGPASSYSQFYENLKAQGSWWHYLPSTWLIATQKTPGQVFEAIRGNIQSSDHIFIGVLQKGYTGWLPKDAWAWIQRQGLSSIP